jgi:hypothetical protein
VVDALLSRCFALCVLAEVESSARQRCLTLLFLLSANSEIASRIYAKADFLHLWITRQITDRHDFAFMLGGMTFKRLLISRVLLHILFLCHDEELRASNSPPLLLSRTVSILIGCSPTDVRQGPQALTGSSQNDVPAVQEATSKHIWTQATWMWSIRFLDCTPLEAMQRPLSTSACYRAERLAYRLDLYQPAT